MKKLISNYFELNKTNTMNIIEEDDDLIIEDFGLANLVAMWKKEFNNIKDKDISKKQSLTFYLEIIEGKMTETTKDKVNEFLKILEIQFPGLFTQVE